MVKQVKVVLKRSLRIVLFMLTLRVLVYALFLGGIAYGMLWGAVVYDDAFFDELDPVEVLETVFAVSAGLIFLLAARKDSSKTPCAVLLAGLFFCASIRESDWLLDTFIGRHSWKIGVVLVLIGMVFSGHSPFFEA